MLSKHDLKKRCAQAWPISATDSEHNYVTTVWSSSGQSVIPSGLSRFFCWHIFICVAVSVSFRALCDLIRVRRIAEQQQERSSNVGQSAPQRRSLHVALAQAPARNDSSGSFNEEESKEFSLGIPFPFDPRQGNT
jgi:hypothetical protein